MVCKHQNEQWADGLVQRADKDLKRLFDRQYFDRIIERRLAFRELGTALGIGCCFPGAEWGSRKNKIIEAWERVGLVPNLEKATSAAGYNAVEALQLISLVMYAAALNPGGKLLDSSCLNIASVKRALTVSSIP